MTGARALTRGDGSCRIARDRGDTVDEMESMCPILGLWMLLLPLADAGPPGASESVCPNRGFEKVTAQGMPADWGFKTYGKDNQAQVSTSTERAAEGARSLFVQVPRVPQDMVRLSARLCLQGGQRYRVAFRCWRRAAGRIPPRVRVRVSCATDTGPWRTWLHTRPTGTGWEAVEKTFILPARIGRGGISMYVGGAGGPGKVWIDDVSVTARLLTPAEQASRITIRGEQFISDGYTPAHPRPKVTAADRTRAFVVFSPGEQDGLRPTYRPAEDEIGAPLTIRAARGETTCGTAAVYALRSLDGLTARLSGLRSPAGRTFPRRAVRVHKVRCWRQRYGMRSFVYYDIPEILDANGPGPVQAEQVQQYWLTVTVPRDVAPGDYAGELMLSASRGTASVPLRIRVRPFVLPEAAGREWGLYTDAYPWKSERYTRDVIEAELKDMIAHGINTLRVYPLIGDFSIVDGRPRFEPGKWTEILRLIKKHGFRGPFVANVQGLAGRLKAALGADKARAGDEFWCYGIGCYRGQEGRVLPNRYAGGFLFWKTGARRMFAWTFQRPRGRPYDDFDGLDYCITYPAPDSPVSLRTLQWEGIREGVNDARYALCLESLVRGEARSLPAAVVARARLCPGCPMPPPSPTGAQARCGRPSREPSRRCLRHRRAAERPDAGCAAPAFFRAVPTHEET